MKIARIRIQRFRGFECAIVQTPGHLAAVGEPRAGRSDLIEAIRRVLDPRSTASRVNPLDIHRPIPDDNELPLTEVEVTLLKLGSALEQLLDAHLEVFDSITGEIAGPEQSGTAELGVRLCYRARYDSDSDTGEHWVDWPGQSDPASGVFAKARKVEREAIPFLVVQPVPALQLRAEGAFRALVENAAPEELQETLQTLWAEVTAATDTFAGSGSISSALKKVIVAGTGDLLGLTDTSEFSFVPDDGSLAALLRALQPALALDAAGLLPLRSHGSTTAGVLSFSEAVATAEQEPGGLVVIVDDFGDALDAPSAEYLAILLKKRAQQVIVTTRRPEVVRAFDPEEILRLTRSHGSRCQHRLESTTDRKAQKSRRDLLDQLTSAMTGSIVTLMEGSHDVEGFGAVSVRRARRSSVTSQVLPAHGVRLACAVGEHGGKDSLPELAKLAGDLGFHVRIVVDDDKPGENDDLFDVLEELAEQLVILPERTAVEGALVRGINSEYLLVALQSINDDYDLRVNFDEIELNEIADYIIKKKLLKKKNGLHRQWVNALPRKALPPIALEVLEAVCSDQKGRIRLEAPK